MMMKAKTIAEHFNVHVMRIGGQWHAFRGGWGTGEPVVDIAKAYRTDTLWQRVAKALAHERKDAHRD
jgi:hypothetical protein